eukprot:2673588-Pyramimonas_sp.AAC.1
MVSFAKSRALEPPGKSLEPAGLRRFSKLTLSLSPSGSGSPVPLWTWSGRPAWCQMVQDDHGSERASTCPRWPKTAPRGLPRWPQIVQDGL